MTISPSSAGQARTRRLAGLEDFGQIDAPTLTFPSVDPLSEYRWNDRAKDLPRAVESVWIYGGPDKRLSSQTLTGHWKTCVAVFRRWDSDGHVSDVELRLLGPVTVPVHNGEDQHIEVIAARLFPEFAIPLLSLRPSEISNANPDWPTRLIEAGAGVRRLAEAGARAELVASELCRTVEFALPADFGRSGAAAAVQAIRSAHGRLNLSSLPASIGMSERALRRACLDEIGLSAKTYARFVRHQKLLQATMGISSPDWADLAIRLGYSDQAHLVRETKAMSGLTPVALHAQRTGSNRRGVTSLV